MIFTDISLLLQNGEQFAGMERDGYGTILYIGLRRYT